MTPPSERKAKERQAKRDAGLVRVEVWVPRAMVDEVRKQVGKVARRIPGPILMEKNNE